MEKDDDKILKINKLDEEYEEIDPEDKRFINKRVILNRKPTEKEENFLRDNRNFDTITLAYTAFGGIVDIEDSNSFELLDEKGELTRDYYMVFRIVKKHTEKELDNIVNKCIPRILDRLNELINKN